MDDGRLAASQAYGALFEGVHVAGYTMERAWEKLEWLLEENRWQHLGVTFKDVNAFLDSIKLDNLRIVADQRKRIAQRIKELQPKASARAIGRTLGADHVTIGYDLKPSGKSSPPPQPKSATSSTTSSPNSPPLSGAQVAALAQKAETKNATQAAKKDRRETRERELAAATIATSKSLNKKIYNAILADPPWRWEPYSRETGMDRAADNHYPTMLLADITALKVPAADDCVLFLWATIPMLPQALEVMAAWGFTYKSQFVWVKDQIGPGYWAREQHELLLIGTTGNIPAPAPGEQYPSVIFAPRAAHSAKPACVYEMIEEMFPTLPRLEMFARGEGGSSAGYPPGWDQWGNEAAEAADD